MSYFHLRHARQRRLSGLILFALALQADGAATTFLWLPHITAYVPPVEAIGNVNVVTDSYDAEQGLAGGAVINVSLKSGTNDFHGSAFEFHTNSALQAKNFFLTSPRSPKNILNQFGGTLRGPIVKNKLFFFLNYEGMRQNQNFSRFVMVPNADQRVGDFSAYGVKQLTERFKLQFRTEVFNLTNTPHFNKPGINVSNMSLDTDGTICSLGGFSEVTSARDDQRQVRFALSFSF